MQFFRPLGPRKALLVDREWLRVLLPKYSLLDVSPRNLGSFCDSRSIRPAVIGMLDDLHKSHRISKW